MKIVKLSDLSCQRKLASSLLSYQRKLVSSLRNLSYQRKLVSSFLFIFIFLLEGCASSDAARGAASDADQAYLETSYQLAHVQEGELSAPYQNSSQTAKGALLGGALGAAAGGATSGVTGILPGFGLGAIFGGAIGAYIDSHTTLADKLENRGIQVIRIGDQIMLIIPSFVMFDYMTSNLLPSAYQTLDLVVQYIHQFPNMSVKVSAFTSAVEPEDVSIRLSQQQAEKVLRYLWNRRLDTRLLYAEGYGGTKLVTANTGDWGSDNYRIEITLEALQIV